MWSRVSLCVAIMVVVAAMPLVFAWLAGYYLYEILLALYHDARRR